MPSLVNKSSLASTFSLPSDSPLLSTLARLSSTHSAIVPSAQDLLYKWEALALSLSTPARGAPTLDEQSIALLEQSLVRDEEQRLKAMTAATPARKAGFAGVAPSTGRKSALSGMLGLAPQTPARGSPATAFKRAGAAASTSAATPSRAPHTPAAAPLAPPPITPASASSTAAASPLIRVPLEPLETLNAHLEEAAPGPNTPGPVRVALAVGTDLKAWSYRYMFERLGAKGEALDDRIDAISATLIEAHGLNAAEIADASQPSQEPVYVIGRICPLLPTASLAAAAAGNQAIDAELADLDDLNVDNRGFPPLRHDNMVLEASRLVGAGSRTPLHFPASCVLKPAPGAAQTNTDARAGLFPGMIVALLGKNGGANSFVVDEILLPPPLPHASTAITDLMNHQYAPGRMAGAPLSIMLSAGPYTPESDLLFKPWHRLMDEAERARPDVLLLLGPFLSATHPALLAPGQDQLPTEIFKQHISARLERMERAAPRTTVILVPSTRDAASAHAAWPQPMLDKKDAALGIPKRIKCLPNPCLFNVNEVVFGVTTGDVLRDLGKEETCIDVRAPYETLTAKVKETDNLGRLCRHVLGQRSFYPIFPASMATSHPLDVTHSSLAHFNGVTPDVLLLPSLLRATARTVDSTLIVNPGSTAKGKEDAPGAGSFVKFSIAPLPKAELEAMGEEDAVHHRIYERARVDVVRI